MKRVYMSLIIVAMYTWSASAVDYIHDESGKNIVYEGKYENGANINPFSLTILVTTAQKIQDRSFDVVHYNVLKAKTSFQERTLYYNIKPDGIYLEAIQEGKSPIAFLNDPSLELPLPATPGQKFKRVRNEDLGTSTLEFEVISVNEPLAIGDTAPETIHIRGIGTFRPKGTEQDRPLKKEIWYGKEGKLKQITIHDLPDGTQSKSQIQYVKTIDLNTTSQSPGTSQAVEVDTPSKGN